MLRRHTAVGCHFPEQVGHFDVGVTLARTLYLGSFAKQGIGLIEKQDGITGFGSAEDLAQVLFGLADVFAHDRGQVDAVEIETELVGHDLRRHRLAGAARS